MTVQWQLGFVLDSCGLGNTVFAGTCSKRTFKLRLAGVLDRNRLVSTCLDPPEPLTFVCGDSKGAQAALSPRHALSLDQVVFIAEQFDEIQRRQVPCGDGLMSQSKLAN